MYCEPPGCTSERNESLGDDGGLPAAVVTPSTRHPHAGIDFCISPTTAKSLRLGWIA